MEEFKKGQKGSLFLCEHEIEERIEEKWPVGRRSSNTVPKSRKKSYHIKVNEVKRNEAACERYLNNESAIVIISNEEGQMSNKELLQTYKDQQVVENSFRTLKT